MCTGIRTSRRRPCLRRRNRSRVHLCVTTTTRGTGGWRCTSTARVASVCHPPLALCLTDHIDHLLARVDVMHMMHMRVSTADTGPGKSENESQFEQRSRVGREHILPTPALSRFFTRTLF